MERSQEQHHSAVSSQTDAFKPKPPDPPYIPPKTGSDVGTQIINEELFNFDLEVEPLLNVGTVSFFM